MRRHVYGLCAGALLAAAQTGAADDTAPDTSNWACRFCAFEGGSSGWLEPALGYAATDSVRFGDYTGRGERGLQPDLAGLWRYRDTDTADRWDASVDRLGLDSRALSLGGGRQGRYRVALDYASVPHLLARDTATPFQGESMLALPAGWTHAGSTGGMSDLDASLHGTALEQRRDRAALAVAFKPTEPFDLQFGYRRDAIDGARGTGGSFMTLASQLVQPVDQTLEQVDASVAYHHSLGAVRLALSSSRFSNRADALTWENPYNAPSPGATAGRLAAAPDNTARRISLSIGSSPLWPLQLAGQVALGRLSQDERFVPATENPNQATALPRVSLDGRVSTTFATARAAYSPWRALRVSADLLHDERDNRTPVASYTQVVMDTFTGNVRQNLPYDFTRDRWRLSVEGRSRLRLGAGIGQDRRERSLGTALDTREQTLWLRAGWRAPFGSDLRVRASHAVRDGASIAAAASENTLMRAFQASDRRRNELRADLNLPLAPWASADLNFAYGRSRYPDTLVGRTGQRELGYGAQLGLQPLPEFSASIFASRRQQDTAQAGSDNFSAPDWLAEQKDVATVAGVHLARHRAGGLDFGADYTWSGFDGAVALDVGTLDMAFPTLVTHLQEARAFGAYDLRPQLTLRLDVLYQHFEAHDWALDGVAPDAVPNLLALGLGTQSGEAGAAILGLRYRFAGVAPPAD